MCGIAGIIGRLGHRNEEAVARMASGMAHRGPDGSGSWTSAADGDGWGCILVHRRLSVLDLSTAADQPMTESATGATLVYNGELYNYEDLRHGLEARGEQFRSTGDTEVLLRMLARDGIDALPHLRGMFALALWEPTARTLTLARDPLGIKPLYVARNADPRGEWRVAFASELRALLGSGLLPDARIDPEAVAAVVWNGFVTGPTTMVRGVELVGPARAVVLDGRGSTITERRYWRLPAPGTSSPSDEGEVADALRSSVARHLASDVPLGVFLSSGIDSSAVANLAQQAHDQPIRCFTLAFEDAALDESRPAAAIAAAIGAEHERVLLGAADFAAGLDHAMAALDQPTFDGLNSYFMAAAVRSAGITVALVGTGGDELFGGYETFRQLPRLVRVLGSGGALGRAARSTLAAMLGRVAARGSGPVPRQTRWAKLPALVGRADDIVSLYQLSYALFLPDFQRRLLGGTDPLPDGVSGSLGAELRELVAGRPTLSAISALEQRSFLGERLLRDSDAASMAVSLELRLPLVDHVLTEVVDRLPAAQRYQPVGKKAMLRRIGLAGLDPTLFDRPKQGFVLPIEQWLRMAVQADVEATLHDAASCERVGLDPAAVRQLWDSFQAGSPGLYWTRVWALYVLIRWSTEHRVHV